MSYNNYRVEDFLADESFQQYCEGSDEIAVDFWNNILVQEPGIQQTFDEAKKYYHFLNGGQGNLKEETERLQNRISQLDQPAKPKLKIAAYRWIAAASIIFLIGIGGYLYLDQSPEKRNVLPPDLSVVTKNDVTPGGNRAMLTLADGSQIILDSAQDGNLSRQGNTDIIKLSNGELVYTPTETKGEIFYNTVTTPKGGQYNIVLPDGSKVWLNAASSIKFPTAFEGKERTVELTGEGYFEVAKNTAMPFRVKSDDAIIEVLGTHLNINSYKDEGSIKTTLLEGSVKVLSSLNPQSSTILKPGQQARLIDTEKNIRVSSVDVNHEVAWKDGLFDFDNDTFKDIMHQLARWYDVDPVYAAGIPNKRYTGTIRRQVNISQILKMLEIAGGVELAIDGRKIIVKQT